MDEARDDMYCHLTARRSVATAALRLGLQRMSEEALDSVAGVLIGYVERIGETLAASVEASGRSSAHCHAWDALRAIEQCTEPAVWRMHLTDTTTANTTTTTTAAAGQQSAQSQQQQPTNGASVSGTAADDSLNNASSVTTTTTTNGEAAGTSATGGDNSNGAPTNTNNNSNQNGDHPSSKIMTDPAEVLSWKGLAAFCFGPQWSEPITEDELASMNMMMMNGAAAAAATSDAPGKVGPSSLLLMMDTAAANNSINTSTTAASAADGRPGWHAPFPEEVPIFPVTHQRQTAHPVPPQLQSTADSLHPTPESLALQHSKQQTDIEDTTNAHALNKDDNDDDLVDAIFQKSMWGQARPTPAHVGDKRTRDKDDPMEVDPEPPTKKSKTNAAAANKTTTDALQVDSSNARDADDDDHDDDEDAAHPSYVPHFFPPFPRRTDLVGPIVADDEEEDGDGNNPDDPTSRNSTTLASTSTQTDLAQTTTTSINNSPEEDELCASSSLQVRSALVKLGRPWGAMETASTTTTAQDPRLVVPAGGEASNSSSSGNNTTAPIVPLNKPSGSRPCKIMEGSMDSFA